MKKCNKCEIEKELLEFYKDSGKKDGFRNICKDCSSKQHKNRYQNRRTAILEQKKEYYKDNIEKIKQKDKIYREENAEKISKYQKENKEKINQQKNQYRRERRKNDPLYRLKHNLRGLTYKAMKRGYKSASTQELLGCTWEEARNHLENQFVEGMSWENYGEWEIDHIKPIAAFTDLTDPEQQRQCCHYSNLRPLWMWENRSRGSLWNGIKHYHTPPACSF